MSKLTARLSDGQEVELVPEAYCDKGQMYLVRPLNYKPSPPKEVWVTVGPTDVGFAYKTYQAGKVRYILAPEPEPQPKPAREWWVVRYKQSPHVIYCTVDTRDEAESVVREDSNGAFKQFEIVHVREVGSDGK